MYDCWIKKIAYNCDENFISCTFNSDQDSRGEKEDTIQPLDLYSCWRLVRWYVKEEVILSLTYNSHRPQPSPPPPPPPRKKGGCLCLVTFTQSCWLESCDLDSSRDSSHYFSYLRLDLLHAQMTCDLTWTCNNILATWLVLATKYLWLDLTCDDLWLDFWPESKWLVTWLGTWAMANWPGDLTWLALWPKDLWLDLDLQQMTWDLTWTFQKMTCIHLCFHSDTPLSSEHWRTHSQAFPHDIHPLSRELLPFDPLSRDHFDKWLTDSLSRELFY